MRPANNRKDSRRGHRRDGGRTVVRLDANALWDRLALLNRSQSWLAGEVGISKGYMSLLVSEGARALRPHPPADAEGPRHERLPPTIPIGGER